MKQTFRLLVIPYPPSSKLNSRNNFSRPVDSNKIRLYLFKMNKTTRVTNSSLSGIVIGSLFCDTKSKQFSLQIWTHFCYLQINLRKTRLGILLRPPSLEISFLPETALSESFVNEDIKNTDVDYGWVKL